MVPPQLIWYCEHCSTGPYNFAIDARCPCCYRNRDNSVIIPLGDELTNSLSHQGDLPTDPGLVAPPRKSTTKDTRSPVSINVDKPYDTGVFQTYSIAPGSQFEDYLFSWNNPGGQDWVPSEKIRFSEAKGLLTFSLATGEPATAPRRRAYSPARRAEVALVRKHRACSSCRLRKQAVSYSISLLALYMLIVHL